MSRQAPGCRLILQVPDTAQPEAYFAGLLASALAVVAGAATLFLVAVLFGRTSGQVAHPDRFTSAGRIFIHPEHETLFFLAACALGVVVVGGQTIGWNRRMRGNLLDPAPQRSPAWLGLAATATAGAALAAGGGLAFLFGRHYVLANRPIPRVDLVVLLFVVGACALVGSAGFKDRFSWYPPWLRSPQPVAASLERSSPVIGDVVVPLFVVAVLFVPAWRLLAGRAYLVDHLLHWDYFAMGATTAFVHGEALGTQINPQYGVGWPLLFGLLKPLLAVSYGHMILVASITECLYFIGVYLLLRVTTHRAAWAAAGTLLALILQVFSGNFVPVASTTLHFPNISVLRRPMDVWVFLVLALHLRTGRRVWAVVAGVLTGVAMVFSTDTGLFLAAILLLYWGCVATMAGRRHLLVAATSLVAMVGVFLLGLGIASRGTLFSGQFWTAWFEPLAEGAAGYTALPIVGRVDVWSATLPGQVALVGFVALVVFYLTIVCHLMIKALHRRALPIEVLLGCVSANGLLSLINFVGRSDSLVIPHLLIPFVVLVTILGARGHHHAMTRVRGRAGPSAGFRPSRVALSAVPLLLVALLGVALAVNPSVRDYPGVLQTIGNLSPPDGRCILTGPRDVCGLPTASAHDVREFRSVIADIRRVGATGRLALIDYQADYNVGADLTPFGLYAPLLPVLFEQRQLQAAMAQLLRERPMYVFLRSSTTGPSFADAAAAFRELLQRYYTVDHTVGPFEVYKVAARPPM